MDTDIKAVLARQSRWAVVRGDALSVLRETPDASIDAIVTDPPAGISFMGKSWDDSRGGRDKWIAWLAEIMCEALRVAKPGAHALVWALPRTSHWTATALEDAGWEVRDRITHLFGSGFPKSLDVSRAIDAREVDDVQAIRDWVKNLGPRDAVALAAGVTPQQVDHWIGENTPCPQMVTGERFVVLCEAFNTVPPWADKMFPKEREVIGRIRHSRSSGNDFAKIPGSKAVLREVDLTTPASNSAKAWEGWGTALKPAVEDWWLCRKPIEGTVAANVLAHGTGALNIDDCRIGGGDVRIISSNPGMQGGKFSAGEHEPGSNTSYVTKAGRYPPHFTLSHAEGCTRTGTRKVATGTAYGPGASSIYGNQMCVKGDGTAGYASPDGTETIDSWDCVDGCPVRELDEQAGNHPGCKSPSKATSESIYRFNQGNYQSQGPIYIDDGPVTRFFPVFYAAKAPSSERPGTLMCACGVFRSPSGSAETVGEDPVIVSRSVERLAKKRTPRPTQSSGQRLFLDIGPTPEQTIETRDSEVAKDKPFCPVCGEVPKAVFHPTQKAEALMRWLVRLITPPQSVVLDPFAGSGSTLCSALLEGFRAIGVEQEEEYVLIARYRCQVSARKGYQHKLF